MLSKAYVILVSMKLTLPHVFGQKIMVRDSRLKQKHNKKVKYNKVIKKWWCLIIKVYSLEGLNIESWLFNIYIIDYFIRL